MRRTLLWPERCQRSILGLRHSRRSSLPHERAYQIGTRHLPRTESATNIHRNNTLLDLRLRRHLLRTPPSPNSDAVDSPITPGLGRLSRTSSSISARPVSSFYCTKKIHSELRFHKRAISNILGFNKRRCSFGFWEQHSTTLLMKPTTIL